LRLAALSILLLALALLPPALTAPGQAQDCTRTASAGESVSGELRGPENSGETHVICVRAERGYWLRVRVEVFHKEFLSSRVITGLSSEGGGYLLYMDEVLPSGGRRVYEYNWYVTEAVGVFRVVLTSVANRLAPSVVGYTVTVSQERSYDAELVLLRTGGASEEYSMAIPDAPGEVFAPEGVPELPEMKPGQTLVLTGHLSASITRESGDGATLYGGRDGSDIYALTVTAPANAPLNITLKPSAAASLQVVLRSEDGASLLSAASKKPGEEASISTSTSRGLARGRLLIDVQLLRSSEPSVPYTLTVSLGEPPKQPAIEADVKPPFPESQARAIVLGFSATVIALTAASVVLGWVRRRPGRAQPYYW